MTPSRPRRLVVKCTAGSDDPERCNQAFMVAATAIASGADVSLWLLPGRAEEFELPHASPLAQLRDAVLAGGTLTVCTQCAERRGITEDATLTGVRVAGSTSFVEEVLQPEAQALVY